jgi:pimeloyl-ACP methyl ester carboxylesterase
MPFASHEGDKIHYEVYGDGPPMIIHHGLFSSAEALAYPQFVEAVSGAFQMIFIDSLGHGESDMQDDPSHYTREHRAGDIVAVLDDLGIEQAYYFGYSMGGWLGTAMAKYAPERLAALCIAGWPIERAPHPEMVGMDADEVWATVKRGLFFGNSKEFANITERTEQSIRNCMEAIVDNDGALEAVKALNCPVMMACGDEDDMFQAAETAANKLGVKFLAVPGDHGAAINRNFGYWFPQVADFFLGEE